MSLQSEHPGYNYYPEQSDANQEDMLIPRIEVLKSCIVRSKPTMTTQTINKPVTQRTQSTQDAQGAIKRRRTAFTSHQISTLEKTFAVETYLSKVKRSELAQQLSTTERIIKIWFQNRRMKRKREREAKNIRGSIHSASDQSETSSMVSDNVSVYSDSNKNLPKNPNDCPVPNEYQKDKIVGVQPFQQFVGNSNTNSNNKNAGFQQFPHYGVGGNFNGGFYDNFNYNYDPFFDPYMGYNFGNSFDNIFSNLGNPNYYSQPPQPPMMPNPAYHNPMNIDCNAEQFVGPMPFNEDDQVPF